MIDARLTSGGKRLLQNTVGYRNCEEREELHFRFRTLRLAVDVCDHRQIQCWEPLHPNNGIRTLSSPHLTIAAIPESDCNRDQTRPTLKVSPRGSPTLFSLPAVNIYIPNHPVNPVNNLFCRPVRRRLAVFSWADRASGAVDSGWSGCTPNAVFGGATCQKTQDKTYWG